MPSRYPDRRAAGRLLAAALSHLAQQPGMVVLALPRGGVPVGAEVARALGLPLDVFLVRKLGVPGHEELAFGAIASGGTRVVNPDVVEQLQLPSALMESVALREAAELARRELAYRHQRAAIELQGRAVILVDDGLATGATMRAAVEAVRKRGALQVIVAVPVASPSTCEVFEQEADALVCPMRPQQFEAVGQWYLDFSQTTDEEVRAALAEAAGA